jgi:hypothetical protein
MHKRTFDYVLDGVSFALNKVERQMSPILNESANDPTDEGTTAPVMACALRVHLGGLLRAMVDGQICTREHVRQFVLELEQEALGVG